MAVLSALLRGLLGLLIGVAALATFVRLTALDRGYPLVTIMTVFPYLVGVAGVLTLISLVRNWRIETWVGAAVVLAGVAVLVPRVVPGPTPAVDPDGPAFTVAVANLRLGRGDAPTVVAAVDRHDVDALVVTELTEDAITRLEDAGLDALMSHRTLLPSRLTSGGGIYSRYRLDPRAPSTQRRFGRTPRSTITLDSGRRVELDAVHPLPPVSASWVAAWREALHSLPSPTAGDGAPMRILAGDFNATADHRAFRELLARGWVDVADAAGAGLRPTFSALRYGEPVPPVTLDHVLIDRRTKVEAVVVEPLPRSDHRILVAKLRLPAA